MDLLNVSHAHKSLLFNEIWLKKGNPDFDVTMGSFDDEEKYDLVGLYLLDSKKDV